MYDLPRLALAKYCFS